MGVRLVAVDIDGTLTRWRGDLLLSLEAIEAVRRLEDNGIMVSLVSGNSLPVTAGVSRYMGASGPVIGENGCLILYRGRLVHVCRGRPPNSLVKLVTSLGLEGSWQNEFRFHDYSFHASDESLLSEAARIVAEHGFSVYLSGYALHIQPPGGGKGVGLATAVKLAGISLDDVVAVGDGMNDIPMLRIAGYSACPSDADEEVKSIVDYVASRPGGLGFKEIVDRILAGTLPKESKP